MNGLARFREAPITAEEAKLNIFAPITVVPNNNKAQYQINEVVYEDDRYKVSISGTRLTQVHRDILDIALFYGDYKLEEEIEENIPVRTFSLYMIQDKLKRRYKTDNEWCKERFKELKRAVITLEDKIEHNDYEFNIVRASKHSKKLNTFVLILEELYLAFFEKKISIDYKTLLDKIIDLKHAQTKAVVRYFLTHSQGHQINIDKLLRKIGIKGDKRNLEYYRNIVLNELEEVKEDFNIELIKTTQDKRRKSDITVKYTRHEKVKIYYPLEQPTLF